MKSKKMIDQILALHKSEYPIRKIAKSLQISRNTVRRYLKEASEKKDSELTSIKVATKQLKSSALWQNQYDWEEILKQNKSGKTAKQLYYEHQPPVKYLSFARVIAQKKEKTTKPSLNLSHEPGEKVQVDYSTGIDIIDPRTGKATKTHLFCGVLPFSSYSFGYFSLNQKLDSYIKGHEKMWNFFGGVTPYVVLDNLKAGVKKAHQYDPELNEVYCDYANHAGFAGLPTRPYSPKDKAAVESAIGVLKKTFYQEVMDKKYYSLDELNQDLKDFLVRFNKRIMKNYGVSRLDRFQHEKDLLKPVPKTSYQIYEMKKAKVHPDCCIQIDKNFYSIPFKFCGQFVRVKLMKNTIEVFNLEAKSIAYHTRVYGVGKSVINQTHLPEKQMQESRFEIQNAIKQSSHIGPKFHELILKQFDSEFPLQRLRRVQGLLRLRKSGTSTPAMEYASSQALTFNKYTLSYFKNCVKFFEAGGQHLKSVSPKRNINSVHLHNEN